MANRQIKIDMTMREQLAFNMMVKEIMATNAIEGEHLDENAVKVAVAKQMFPQAFAAEADTEG
jgi:hypothetical protein